MSELTNPKYMDHYYFTKSVSWKQVHEARKRQEDAINLQKSLYLEDKPQIDKIIDQVDSIINCELKSDVGKKLLEKLWFAIHSGNSFPENKVQTAILELNKSSQSLEIHELTHPVNALGYTGMSTICMRCREGILYPHDIERPRYCESCIKIIEDERIATSEK